MGTQQAGHEDLRFTVDEMHALLGAAKVILESAPPNNPLRPVLESAIQKFERVVGSASDKPNLLAEFSPVECSPHWEERRFVSSFQKDGFPFIEGFPRRYRNKSYTIITMDGVHHFSTIVDDSKVPVDGLRWWTMEGRPVRPNVVIAWCEEVEE